MSHTTYLNRRLIFGLPDNTALPERLHDLADQWRKANARLEELVDLADAAEAAIEDAKKADAEAIRKAVVEGTPIPTPGQAEAAARAKLEGFREALPAAAAEVKRISEQLLVELRKDEARHHIAAHAQKVVKPALDAYRKALNTAEKTMREATGQLAQATELLGFLDDLDSGVQFDVSPHPERIPTPDFSEARQTVNRLDEKVDHLDQRARPGWRRARFHNGQEATLDTQTAVDLARAGQIAEWIDGLPPEQVEVEEHIKAKANSGWRPIRMRW